jgi:tripartite-type tricarboxylate transporter receptor subunit TctC
MSNRYGWFVTCMAVAFAPVPAITVMVDRLSDTVTAADGTAAGITDTAGNHFKRASALFFYARALCRALSGGLAPALFLSLRASSPMIAPTNKGGITAMGRVLCVLLAAAWLALGVVPCSAQNYPTRPVRLVVGFPAGGPTDAIARIVAQKLSDKLGQQFFVENIGGAGGNTAAGQVARAAPDGYTIMAISTGFVVNPSLYAKVPYDPIKDFAPVTLVAVSPNVVVVNPTVPAKSLPELVQLIRDNPGKYSFAGPGVGSTPHLGGELFRLAFDLDLVHVPFTGAGPAIQATVGGHTPIAFTALPPALSAVQSGQLRALGVAANERAAGMPDVPTFAEQGVNDQEADTLTGIVAPAGTPREVIDLLYRETANAVRQPEVSERLKVLGFKAVVDTPDEFGARIKLEIEKWGKVVRNAKLRID